jgi:hypothetical protein
MDLSGELPQLAMAGGLLVPAACASASAGSASAPASPTPTNTAPSGLTGSFRRATPRTGSRGAVGLRRRPHRGAVHVRVARQLGYLVSFLRQRELGVQRGRPDASAVRLHQRPSHQGSRPQVPLARRASSGRPPRPDRVRSLGEGRLGTRPTATGPGNVRKHSFADMRRPRDVARASGLEWTIVRPRMLTNGSRTGSYRRAILNGLVNEYSRAV